VRGPTRVVDGTTSDRATDLYYETLWAPFRIWIRADSAHGLLDLHIRPPVIGTAGFHRLTSVATYAVNRRATCLLRTMLPMVPTHAWHPFQIALGRGRAHYREFRGTVGGR